MWTSKFYGAFVLNRRVPSTRRLLDGVAMPVLTPRRSQHGSVIAEKCLSEELSGAPDALVDFHTDSDQRRQRDLTLDVRVDLPVDFALEDRGLGRVVAFFLLLVC